MSTEPFEKWLDRHSSPRWFWYVKRLSANDTGATGGHQAGPYFPKHVIFSLLPTIAKSTDGNPEATIPASLDSHGGSVRNLRAIWYNQATRDECRLTGWGGSQSVLLDPESTGSICIFAFHQEAGRDADTCKFWLCNLPEEELFEDKIVPIEPGAPLFLEGGKTSAIIGPALQTPRTCWLTEESMPAPWRTTFPTGADIVAKSVELRPLRDKSADDRLLVRRECEYEMFRSVEQLLVLPVIRRGFQAVDEFIDYSNAVNNRRKARSGRSLELHLVEIFKENGARFSHGEVSEGTKKPDFLFPSAEAYRANKQPLWMLAAKTTCKDRWRQILNEADRVPKKHLITLQEGVSYNQYVEMRNAGVTLVVPEKLQKAYPEQVRPELLKLEQFLQQIATP